MPASWKSQNPNPKPQIPTATSQLFKDWDLGFGIWDLLMRRLDMDDDVDDLGKPLHQPIFDDV